MQVTMPPAVRAWLGRIASALPPPFTPTGCLIGEILPVALMLPLVLPLVGGSWQWGLRDLERGRSPSSRSWC